MGRLCVTRFLKRLWRPSNYKRPQFLRQINRPWPNGLGLYLPQNWGRILLVNTSFGHGIEGHVLSGLYCSTFSLPSSNFGLYTFWPYCTERNKHRTPLGHSQHLGPPHAAALLLHHRRIAISSWRKKRRFGPSKSYATSIYRVTIQFVPNLPLTSKQKFRFGTRASY